MGCGTSSTRKAPLSPSPRAPGDTRPRTGFEHPSPIATLEREHVVGDESPPSSPTAKVADGMKIEAELGLTGSEEETAAIAKMQAMQRGKMSRKEK